MSEFVNNMDQATIVHGWRARGFSCDIRSDPPGQVWADFVHPTDELVMLIDGEIELRFSGQVLRPAVGQEILIPAGEAHTVVNSGRTRNRWYYGYKGS